MTTFTRKIPVRMVDPPDVEMWRRISRVFYAFMASLFIAGGIYAAAADIGPDLFPEEPEPFHASLPKWSSP